MAPKADAARRLAAATGDGFSEQVFREDQPPFEIRLLQFGQELRVTASVTDRDSPYANCLAELRLLEGGDCRFSQIILIQDGQGRCLIQQAAIQHARPSDQPVRVAVQPLLTANQLTAVGNAVFVPILERLLTQDDVEIRRAAVRLLGEMRDPAAAGLLGRAAQDADDQVRALAQAALDGTEEHP